MCEGAAEGPPRRNHPGRERERVPGQERRAAKAVDLQLEGTGQWLKGKSLDTFAPLGPWLVTADEVPDPQDLRLWLSVNGETMQDASTADMIFPVAHLVSYISRHMTLLPGDVIATGTPHHAAPPRALLGRPSQRLDRSPPGRCRRAPTRSNRRSR